MKKYIVPAVEVEILAAEEMIALSTKDTPANGSQVLVNEEETASDAQNVWEKEW